MPAPLPAVNAVAGKMRDQTMRPATALQQIAETMTSEGMLTYPDHLASWDVHHRLRERAQQLRAQFYVE